MTEPNEAPTPSGTPVPPAAGWPHIPSQPGYAGQPGYPPFPAPPPGWRPYWPALSPAGQPLASFGERLGAYLIDSLILGAASAVLALPLVIFALFLVVPDSAADAPNVIAIMSIFLLFAVIQIAATYVYFVELMFRTGQTVGKRVLKIWVVPLNPGVRLDRPMAARRWLVQCVVAFVPGFGYVDGFWQLWDKPFQQCLHDKYAQTVVIKSVLPVDTVTR